MMEDTLYYTAVKARGFSTPEMRDEWNHICELDNELADIYEKEIQLKDRAEYLRAEIDVLTSLYRKRHGGTHETDRR